MAGTTKAGVSSAVPRQSTRDAGPSGWVGWIAFASVMMGMVGSFHVIQGLVAIFEDDYYLVGTSGLTVNVDFTAWGWTHILVGAVLIFAAVGLYRAQMWARVLGVLLASLSALLNFAFIAAYPFWSAIAIAINVFVILALTVHGREMKEL